MMRKFRLFVLRIERAKELVLGLLFCQTDVLSSDKDLETHCP